MKKTHNKQFKTFRQIHTTWLKDEAYNKAYQQLDLEFSLIGALVECRLRKGITQKQLAERVGTKQSSIARFESGMYNPTLAFVQKLADAMDAKIRVQ